MRKRKREEEKDKERNRTRAGGEMEGDEREAERGEARTNTERESEGQRERLYPRLLPLVSSSDTLPGFLLATFCGDLVSHHHDLADWVTLPAERLCNDQWLC